MSKPNFSFELAPLRDTGIDVVLVRRDGKFICMIDPASGQICFRNVGLVADVSGLEFLTPEEVQMILDKAKTICEEHEKFGKWVQGLGL